VVALATLAFGLPAGPTHRSAANAATGVTYTYDAAGRLKTVTDPAGATATYSYDAVGNLLSIARTAGLSSSPAVGAGEAAAASPPQIRTISATRATVGTSVSLTGTGFDADRLRDTVRVGRIAATVSAATSSRLTFVVPGGGDGGEVSVTTPAGRAVAPTPLHVVRPTGNPPADPGLVDPAPDLRAPAGVTALSGRTLRTDGTPLAGVTLILDDVSTVSDEHGRFLLAGGRSGHLELVIDGGTVAGDARCGLYEQGVQLVARKTTVLP